jgi:hypothetical protein
VTVRIRGPITYYRSTVKEPPPPGDAYWRVRGGMPSNDSFIAPRYLPRITYHVDNCIPSHNPYVHCSPMSSYCVVLHYLRFYACPPVAADRPIRWLCRPPLSSFHSLFPTPCPLAGPASLSRVTILLPLSNRVL